jgi:endonuclease III
MAESVYRSGLHVRFQVLFQIASKCDFVSAVDTTVLRTCNRTKNSTWNRTCKRPLSVEIWLSPVTLHLGSRVYPHHVTWEGLGENDEKRLFC